MLNQISTTWLFGSIVIVALLTLAALPTLIALARNADEIMLITLVNVLGCAIIVGWPVALVMAIKWPRRHASPPRRTTMSPRSTHSQGE